MRPPTEFVFTDVPFRRRREERVRRLIAIAAVAMIVLCAVWLAVGIARRIAPLIWVEAIGLLSAAGLLFFLRLDRIDLARHACYVLVVGLIVSIMVLEGNSPEEIPILHVYLICVAVGVFLMFFDANPRVPLAYSALCVGLLIARELGWLSFEPVVPSDPEMAAATRHVALISTVLIIVALAMMFVRDIAEAERQLAGANERIEALLENMLPESIARRLREEGHTFADAFATCTILFADLVGFTKIASEHPAAEVVDLLDRVFSRFDDLVETAGVEKIKTIGDAYMVVAGVPRPRPDHATVIATLALQMRDTIHEFGLRLRIGINTGPVVAGVIGKKRFIYDLWGDTVNVASRMESQGPADGIQVTQATWREIHDQFELESRTVEVRGRGWMDVWLLLGPKRVASGVPE